MLLRLRVTSFLCGFAVAGAAAMAAIRQDVVRSGELVAGEARRSRAELERRVCRLEGLLGVGGGGAAAAAQQQQQQAPGPAAAEEPSAPTADAIGLARRVLADAASAAAAEEEQGAAAAPAS